MKVITWRDCYKEIRKQCSRDCHADNIIGHLMDRARSWNWSDAASREAIDLAFGQGGKVYG